MVGLLRPVLPNVVGAATAGILCAVPMALAIRIAVYGLQGWSSNDLLATCIFAVLLGGGGGLIIWREDRRG